MLASKDIAEGSQPAWNLSRVIPWLLLVGGIIATLASLGLSIEVFDRLKNPGHVSICNLNPVLSCTSVADSPQSEVFGFPNYFIGIAGFAALAAIGLALLAGAKFKRWFWLALEAGLLAGIGFVFWLQFESLYRIGGLCIFCMIVWAVMIPMFWYTSLYILDKGLIKVPVRLKSPYAFVRRHHVDVLIVWYLIIIVLIIKRFWYYWSTLF